MESKRLAVIGTIGHIDHSKTTCSAIDSTPGDENGNGYKDCETCSDINDCTYHGNCQNPQIVVTNENINDFVDPSDFEHIKGEALFYAMEHKKNYNVVIVNPVDNAFGEGSSYKIVDDSFLESEEGQATWLVYSTDPAMKSIMRLAGYGKTPRHVEFPIADLTSADLTSAYTQKRLKNPKSMDNYVYTNRRGTVRKVNHLSPNDPCHCGSGVKFKKCHGHALYGKQDTTFFPRTKRKD